MILLSFRITKDLVNLNSFYEFTDHRHIRNRLCCNCTWASYKIYKTASALLTGVLYWVVYIMSSSNAGVITENLTDHLGEISGILFLLLAQWPSWSWLMLMMALKSLPARSQQRICVNCYGLSALSLFSFCCSWQFNHNHRYGLFAEKIDQR